MRSTIRIGLPAVILAATACTRPGIPTLDTPAPTTAPSGAQGPLAALVVQSEDTGAHYRRDDWGDWATHAGTCSTRAIVLQRQGTGVTTGKACRITTGTWTSPYDRATVRDPGKLDIDHRVPLAEAARSGARDWNRDQRERFYNDLDNLVAVSATANRSKGDKDPGRWRPSNQDEWCGYATAYITTKTRYQLTIDPRERDGLTALLTTCP